MNRLKNRKLGVVLLSFAAYGCETASHGTVPSDGPTVARIDLAPLEPILTAGDSLVIVATPRDSAGGAIAGPPVTWQSSHPAVVTVSATGLVRGISPGQSTVSAAVGPIVASTRVTITPTPVASIAVTPASATLVVGSRLVLAATVRDAAGNDLSGRTIDWTSSDPSIVAVSEAGELTAVSPGAATVTATCEGRAAQAAVAVRPAPVAAIRIAPSTGTVQVGANLLLIASITDALGQPVLGRPVTWSSSNPTVATVSATGQVSGLAAADVVITAALDGITGTASIMVTPVPVAAVAVAPRALGLRIGQSRTLTATATDSAGNLLTGRPFVWSTSDPAVASVGSTGTVTAIGLGTATITATTEDRSATAAITVSVVPVAMVTVSPTAASLVVGQIQALSATATDAGGAILTGRPVTWTTSDTEIATVSGTGVVTAVAVGSATIAATVEGIAGAAAITVSLIPVASVTVAPAAAAVVVGQTQALAATPKDAGGAILTGRPVTWTTSSAAIATVSGAGVVTAVALGGATITATVEGKNGTSAITVSLVPVASVTTNPGTATLTVGQTQAVIALTKDAGGNLLTGRAVSWVTSSSSVATVSAAGVVTAVALGSVTITATSDGQSGTVSVTVLALTAATFPLRTNAGKRYLVDAQGNPFLVNGDAGWDLIKQLRREDVDIYLEDRRLKGFNTVLVEMMDHFFGSNPPANAYGQGPFTTPGDFATPNEAYFAHAEYVISKAAQKGILVMITPAYMGFGGGAEGWYQEMVANGATKLRAYGQYLATRFRAYDNIIWVAGGDYKPPDRAILRAIQLGIRDIDTKWLHTFHGSRGTTALGFLGSSESWLGLNNIYTTEIVVPSAVAEYTRSTMPFFLIEDRYENSPNGPELVVRRQGYHAVLSGATGRLAGNELLWSFPAGWQSALSSPGSVAMKHLRALLEDGPWWLLQPDRPATLMTVGGGADSDPNIAVAELASDRSFAVAYTPLIKDLTFDLTRLGGPRVQARWYDPTSGAFTIATGSPFPASGTVTFRPPGNNSRGSGDWALRLESIP